MKNEARKSLDRIAAVVIDPTQIPTVDRNNLCAAILPAVNKFYDDPENRKRFEEWKRHYLCLKYV